MKETTLIFKSISQKAFNTDPWRE